MKILISVLISSLILSSCIFFSRTIVKYPVDYSNDQRLDSLQTVKRDFVIKFMTLCVEQNKKEAAKFIADSVNIIWDFSGQPPENINQKDIFVEKGLEIFFYDFFKDPKEILDFRDGYYWPDSVGIRQYHEGGFNVRYGPSRCFDKCAWYNFSFRKKGKSFELVCVRLDG